MMKSVGAVLLGILLALGIGVLMIFGIVAPVFTSFFGTGLASTAIPVVIVVFTAAFAFYFGGMLASYRAPSRRRLHGVLVGVVAFAISPIINLGASAIAAAANDPSATCRPPGALLSLCVPLVAVPPPPYVGPVGARRSTPTTKSLFVGKNV